MAEPLKNLYNKVFITLLSNEMERAYPDFEQSGFINAVFDENWETRELKQRMRHISVSIHAFLPVSYEQQMAVLTKVAPAFNSFTAMVFPDFVEVYGLNAPDISIPALGLFTRYSSSEFAVRPFILQYPERMIRQHLDWAGHANHHVRRLASEGIRPRLPWAVALPFLKKDPSPLWPILEKLKSDPSEYVRRSVANNLNDISKDHPELILSIARQWKGFSPETDGIVRHACRGLLKKGNSSALSVFGFGQDMEIDISGFQISSRSLMIGDRFEFSFQLTPEGALSRKLRLEYSIGFMKANGKLSEKIFKISENNFNPGVTVEIKKQHAFADLTTRKHYTGSHTITIVINGVKQQTLEFELLKPAV